MSENEIADEAGADAANVVESVVSNAVAIAAEQQQTAEQTAEQIAAAALELERARVNDERFDECHRRIETAIQEMRTLLAETFSATQAEISLTAQNLSARADALADQITSLAAASATNPHPSIPATSMEVATAEPPQTVEVPAQIDGGTPPARAKKNRLV